RGLPGRGGRAVAPPSGAPRRGPRPRPADARGARHLVRARHPPRPPTPRRGRGAPRHLPGARAARRACGRAGSDGGRAAAGAEAGARMTPAVALWPGVIVRRRLADYLTLTKPRVVAMVLVTTAAGYYLGSAGTPRLVPLLHTLAGTALAAAGPLALLARGRRAGCAAPGRRLGRRARDARRRAVDPVRDHVPLADPPLARDRPHVPRRLRARRHPRAPGRRPRRRQHRRAGG